MRKGEGEGGKGKGASQSFSKKEPSPAPSWKRVPGTSFVVDGFHHKRPEFTSYFLTHFHSDHYGGLTSGFKSATVCKFSSSSLS
jgi:ribonuclease BN (tRNA processing enzyme)